MLSFRVLGLKHASVAQLPLWPLLKRVLRREVARMNVCVCGSRR